MDESEKIAGAARRSETANSGIAHLMVINGGAAVALLALLQVVWRESPDLSVLLLPPILLYALGAGAAGRVNLLRYKASWFCEKHKEQRENDALTDEQKKWSSRSEQYQQGAVWLFVLGTATAAVGILFARAEWCRQPAFWAEIVTVVLGLCGIYFCRPKKK